MNEAEASGVKKDDRSTKKVRIRDETVTVPTAATVTGPMEGAAAVISPMEEEDVDGVEPGVSVGAGQGAAVGRPSFQDILTEGRAGVEPPVVTEVMDEEVQCEDDNIFFVAGKYGTAVRLSKAFKERLERRWDFAVVVKLLGRPIGYHTLCTRLQALWKPTRSIKIVDSENDFYLVRMDCEEDYYHALADGPWVIMGHALSVQPWDSSFRGLEGKVSQAVILARFVEFPPFWYNSHFLHALGSLVGGTMKVDDNTKKAIRGKYARVAVEVDLQKPLREASSGPLQAPKSAGTGEWMNVPQRVRRRPRQEVETPTQCPVATGSRFSVFNSLVFQETEVQETSHQVPSPRAAGPHSISRPVIREQSVEVEVSLVIAVVEPTVETAQAPSESPRRPKVPIKPIANVSTVSTHTATVLSPQTSQQVYNLRSSGPLVTHELFVEPHVAPPAVGLSRVPASPSKPPDLNLSRRFGRTPEKEKKKQSVALPLKKPALKVLVGKKSSLSSVEGAGPAIRKLKGPRATRASSGV
ncbi:hypothetical protein Tsubulata_037657 [Turnera subulata]|uniref:DUF4283 domain-containing protein n=1 Tax=Turnera subulata TaxID=218843 RepID=A0A9Q0GGB5_9ROSI|nr:hypothetical protein Tsubulata_037657 [Turnera subulata]